MTKEQAQEEFEADYEGNELFDGLPSDVYRDRFHVYLDDISKLTETENAVKEVTGVAKTKSAPEIAEGFTVIRNIAGAVAVILVVILVGGEPVHYRQHHQTGHLQPAGRRSPS